MKLRNAAGAVVGAVGLTALANRVVASRAETFEHALDGDHDTYRWRGVDVAYTEAGDPEDPDLLFVHGINAAASSHEFAPVFDHLADDYHVVAVDLPGFGHSDRPPLLYSASLYTTFLREFVRDRTDDPVVVASSLSGAYAAKAAGDADVSELVLVCPTDETMPWRRVWLRSLLRSPLVGEALFNGMVSKRGLKRSQADHGYADIDNYDDETLAYEWLTSHQPGARYAPASFVSGHLDPVGDDLATVLGDLDADVTLVWGRDAETTPLSTGRELAERADARLVSIERAKLLPHVEHPREFVSVVEERTQPA